MRNYSTLLIPFPRRIDCSDKLVVVAGGHSLLRLYVTVAAYERVCVVWNNEAAKVIHWPIAHPPLGRVRRNHLKMNVRQHI